MSDIRSLEERRDWLDINVAFLKRVCHAGDHDYLSGRLAELKEERRKLERDLQHELRLERMGVTS